MPTITRISEQKRRANRRNIYLDGAFAFGCNLNVVARFHLREGLTLTAEEVQKIELGEVRQECFDRAMSVLMLRLHSRAELHRKLARHEYGEMIVNTVLDDLTRLGYIDDERFAKIKAVSAVDRKHHGRRRTMVELKKAGVTGTVADKALDDVYADRDNKAVVRELIHKQLPRMNKLEPEVARRRLVGMLQRRGFDHETIRPAIEELLPRRAGTR